MTVAARRRLVRIGFGGVGLAFVAVALWRTWDESQGGLLPNAPTFIVAGLVMMVGLVGGGLSWFSLFGENAPRGLIADFYLAQLGKYIPGGGIWQAAGQVGLSVGRGVTATRVSTNLVMHGLIQLISGLTLGGLLVFTDDLSLWLRVLCGLALMSPLLLHRSWMAIALSRLGGILRVDAAETVPPDQRDIIRSWLWSLLPIISFSGAYGLMVHALEPGVGIARGAVAFAMAWALGYAMLPFPAGLGVREAALVVLAGGATATVLATSLVVRLLAIAGDVVLMGATRRVGE